MRKHSEELNNNNNKTQSSWCLDSEKEMAAGDEHAELWQLPCSLVKNVAFFLSTNRKPLSGSNRWWHRMISSATFFRKITVAKVWRKSNRVETNSTALRPLRRLPQEKRYL